MICGNTGVIAGSESCGLCVARGCDGYKMYKENKKKVSSFDDKDKETNLWKKIFRKWKAKFHGR